MKPIIIHPSSAISSVPSTEEMVVGHTWDPWLSIYWGADCPDMGLQKWAKRKFPTFKEAVPKW